MEKDNIQQIPPNSIPYARKYLQHNIHKYQLSEEMEKVTKQRNTTNLN